MVYEFQHQGRMYRLTMECISHPEHQESLTDILQAALLPKAPRYTPKPCRPAALDGQVTTPLPGKVVQVWAKEGDTVKAGDLLVTVEAMKMENELYAPFDGVVESLPVQAGDLLRAGQVAAVIGGAQE